MGRKLLYIIFAGSIFFFFLSSFSHPKSGVRKFSVRAESGDVILRDGRGLLSAVFRNFSLKEKKFSHAGVVIRSGNKLMVYHFIDGDHAGVTIEPIEDFISSNNCRSYSIYRPELSALQMKSFCSSVTDSTNSRLNFDVEFDLNSRDMYCTEFIYKSFSHAGVKLPLTELNGVSYVAPDNIYINNIVKKIAYEAYPE